MSTVLSQHLRSNLLEEEHYGFIERVDITGRVIESFGETFNEPFYLRSCAKPLQASIIVDYDLDLTEKEIALACGSNAGETYHYTTALGFAEKYGIKEGDLRCGVHKPLSKTRQAEMLLKGEIENVFHNNCIGKHLTMLTLCKKLNLPLENYDDINHPVQKIIIKKVNDLCNITKDYPITKDGCGVPILSMPLKNIVLGFLNMFCNPKYEKIKNAILKEPYIFGGEDRTDTYIIQNTGLISKVGAGGLCVVINPEIKEGFIVKMSDCNMPDRELVTISYINKLGWAKIPTNSEIKTLHGEKIGEITTPFISS